MPEALAKRKGRTLGTPKRRVSKEARIWKVHGLKVAGHSDRDIVRILAEDPENPTAVSHQQVNLDWHETVDILRDDNVEQYRRQRQLAITRLDTLLAALWTEAVKGDPESVGQARLLIADMRRIQGLDAPELGDPERPLHIEERVTVDYSGLSTAELATLIAVAERQPNVINGTGRVLGPAGPEGGDGA